MAALSGRLAVIGFAGALFLTTSAYVYLSDLAGAQARGLIATLMLVTGLSGSLFWPLTAFLDHLVGWRMTTGIYAAAMILLIAPLTLLALPDVDHADTAGLTPSATARQGRIFWLLVLAVALSSFVTSGIEAVGISLYRALGADPVVAIGMASFLGVIKVCGRLIDLVGGRRWNALSTGITASGMVAMGLLVLVIFGSAPAAVVTCLLLYGIGSGAFAVARATMPLVFYEKAAYAAAMSAIALPMNLTIAAAAPVLSGVLTGMGAEATLTLLLMCSSISFLLLAMLAAEGRKARADGHPA
ncbi:MFS transporter [Xaviernesmea oryzae]|uniref:MFS transporter n=1 Tax=Xaviernesmea oryzae TaxID=464029 RepID=UPI0008BE24E3|nr:MFS transporter [Xaviernesmea oryzae]SEK68134.1 hypothetical protein SAMN04487976_103279 [Xaviernesmea oryzae]